MIDSFNVNPLAAAAGCWSRRSRTPGDGRDIKMLPLHSEFSLAPILSGGFRAADVDKAITPASIRYAC